ncbi:hypothetical protein HDU82_002503, partial [Entophlyctis luteolus]
ALRSFFEELLGSSEGIGRAKINVLRAAHALSDEEKLMLPSAFTEKELEKIDKEKRKFDMTPELKVKYDAWARAVEDKVGVQNLHIITQKLTIAFLGWSKRMDGKQLDAGWLEEFEKDFKNSRHGEMDKSNTYEFVFHALRKNYSKPTSGEGGENYSVTPEDVRLFLETIPAPLSGKEKGHLDQYNDAKFQIWMQFRKLDVEFGIFQKEVQKYPEIAELVHKTADEDVNDVNKIINGYKDKAFQELFPLTAKFLKEKYFLGLQKDLDETIARLVLEARDESFANNEKVKKIIDFCEIKAFEESRIPQFFREADFVAFQKEIDEMNPGYQKVAQLVIEASEDNFMNKEKLERLIKCCEELPISKFFKKKDFNAIDKELSKKYPDISVLVEKFFEENFTNNEEVERIIIICRDKAFHESQSSISNFFKNCDKLKGAIFGQKSDEIERIMKQNGVDYFFQLVGFVVGLIPFVPAQITDYISSFGKKVNEWSNMKTEAYDLVNKAQSFLTLLLSTSLQLSEFHGEDHNAVEKLCELIDDMAYLYDLQFEECKSMLDNPPKVFGLGIWKRTFDSALDALTDIATDTRDKVSLYTSTVASRTLDEVGKQGKILEFLKQEQSSLAIKLQKTQQSLESKERDLKKTEMSLQVAENLLKGYERLVALTSQANAKINEMKKSIWNSFHNHLMETHAAEDTFDFFGNNIVFGALLYCYGMYHEFEDLIQKIEEIQETVNLSVGGLLKNYSVSSDANFAGLHLDPVHNVRLCLKDINNDKLYEETYWRWTVSLKKKDGKWVVKFRSGIRTVYRRKAIVNHEAWCSVLDKLNNWLGGAENSSDLDSDEELTMSSHDLSPSLEVEPYNSSFPLSQAKLSIGEEHPKRERSTKKQRKKKVGRSK